MLEMLFGCYGLLCCRQRNTPLEAAMAVEGVAAWDVAVDDDFDYY